MIFFPPDAKSIERGCRGLHKNTYDSSMSTDLSASGSTLLLDAVLKEGLGFVRTSLEHLVLAIGPERNDGGREATSSLRTRLTELWVVLLWRLQNSWLWSGPPSVLRPRRGHLMW